MKKHKTFLLYVRNFIFGTEDSLVSTVGLLAGIASAGVSKPSILIAGVVLIFVEAFSMAVGSFLSQQSVEESLSRGDASSKESAKGGFIMFISYLVSGFIPLLPYVFWGIGTALVISIALSLFALFILGLVSAKVLRISALRNGVRMLLIGGIAVAMGVIVGLLLK